MIWLSVSSIKQEQLMVCLQFLVRLNSDLLCVNQLPVCTAGTANRLIIQVIYLFKDIHNSFMDIHNSFMDILNSFMDILK